MTRRIPHCHTCWKPVKGHVKASCVSPQLDMFAGASYPLTLAVVLEKDKSSAFGRQQEIALPGEPKTVVLSWLDIHRAQYAADPRREPDCGGCEYFGLCAAHSILAVDDAEGRVRSRKKEPRAIEEEDGGTVLDFFSRRIFD